MKIDNELVTIIVPIYNAEKYLKNCIESVLNQSYPYFTLLLIDDGSTDNSIKICNYYSNIDKRIKVYSKINSGLRATIKYSLKLVSTKYLLFLDNDDYYDSNYISILLKTINEYDADCVMCGYKKLYPDGSVETPLNIKFKYYNKDEIMNYILFPFYEKDANIYKNWSSPRWNKIYKTDIVRKFIDKLNDEIIAGEDLEFQLNYLLYSNSVVTIDNNLYNYRILENSMAHGFSNKMYDSFKNLETQINILALENGFKFKAKNIFNDNNCLSMLVETIYSKSSFFIKTKSSLIILNKMYKKSTALKAILFSKNKLIKKLINKIR